MIFTGDSNYICDMDFMNDLNTRQREAATSTEGRIRVVAGAGTGKTKALTYRYAYLVNVIGIDPANILCLTFTNKAAAEMRQRIAMFVHSGDYNDFVCTIDGFCVKFLRKEIYRLGFPRTFRILDEDDAKSVAKLCMDELGIKRTEKTVKDFLAGIAAEKALDGYIDTYMLPDAHIPENDRSSNIQCTLKTSDQNNVLQRKTGNSNIACFIKRQLKEYALDFDDIENFTRYILDHFPDAREYWQTQLNYIMVDEAQDCNTDNWDIINKLAAVHGNLFIVGDPDQCIYEWRGAKPNRFVNFPADKTIILDENYRSTPGILDIANCIIANNKNRIPKTLFTRQADGVAVIHYHGKTEKEEAEWIANQIYSIIQNGGIAPSGFAILYRSSYLSRSIEQALMNKQLPYVMWGGVRFFERKEIKDSLSYLRVISNPDDDLSFRRIINVPARGLGKKFMSDLEEESEGKSLYKTLEASNRLSALKGASEFLTLIRTGMEIAKERTISDLLNIILDKSGLKKMYREDQDEDRLENIDELVKSIKSYEESHEGLEITLSDYLQDISLYSNADLRRDTSTIKLMTIHQSKGLEFPYVFVTGLSEGIFPSMRTIREYKKNGEEEERRLMYVAVTRAEKALFLTESEGYNMSTKMNKYPSRFLAEIKKSMIVTEGIIPDYLWRGTKNMVHVLDEETFMQDATTQYSSDENEDPFRIGAPVSHKIFGNGEIIGISQDGETFQVKFQDNAVRFIRKAFLKSISF